ncbi:MAG: hypothetical protein EBY16_07005 [Gammaproteobacteria bacterium]|nr:hypothetical protein [Gammaproteobacteria bacterium]
MKFVKNMADKAKAALVTGAGFVLSSSVWAEDKFASAINGDIKDMLGSDSSFWKIFILVDIILAGAIAVKTKNPLAFLGVLAIAIVPGVLIKTFVF